MQKLILFGGLCQVKSVHVYTSWKKWNFGKLFWKKAHAVIGETVWLVWNIMWWMCCPQESFYFILFAASLLLPYVLALERVKLPFMVFLVCDSNPKTEHLKDINHLPIHLGFFCPLIHQSFFRWICFEVFCVVSKVSPVALETKSSSRAWMPCIIAHQTIGQNGETEEVRRGGHTLRGRAAGG